MILDGIGQDYRFRSRNYNKEIAVQFIRRAYAEYKILWNGTQYIQIKYRKKKNEVSRNGFDKI